MNQEKANRAEIMPPLPVLPPRPDVTMPALPVTSLPRWKPRRSLSIRAAVAAAMILPALLPVVGIPFAVAAFALGAALIDSLPEGGHPASLTLIRVARTSGIVILILQMVFLLSCLCAGVSVVKGYQAEEEYRAHVAEEAISLLRSIWMHFFGA